ncbi:elongation factor P [candidate division KSB1 bacterium 4572_119]|nr:MAG: elongation factor P [candidate division KSB1 bacterium 4572_119]
MAAISEFRRGMAIMFNDDIYVISEFQHATQSRGRAMIKTKLKNVKTGRVIENTFRTTDKVDEIRLDEKSMQYLYSDSESLFFMNTETFDQIPISAEMVGDQKRFLKEGAIVKVLFHGNEPITSELPTTVDLEVTEAEPSVKGDTAGNLTKWVTLETDTKIEVPPFVNEGDVIRVDTRTGDYVSRV